MVDSRTITNGDNSVAATSGFEPVTLNSRAICRVSDSASPRLLKFHFYLDRFRSIMASEKKITLCVSTP